MSNQSITVGAVIPETLPADRFTASDVARVALGNHAGNVASRAVSLARLLGDDLAVAGDYVNAAWHIQHRAGTLVTAAVVAERVRGASWEDIAKACVTTAAKAEEQWGRAVAEWQGKSPAQNLYLRETGRYAKTADRFIESGRPYSPRNMPRSCCRRSWTRPRSRPAETLPPPTASSPAWAAPTALPERARAERTA